MILNVRPEEEVVGEFLMSAEKKADAARFDKITSRFRNMLDWG